MDKAPDAFRTISEVADDLDVPQHVLRFWETRFAQIRPMKRSGGRRYYRPDDVDLLRGIRHLLYGEGYTIRGVQRILREQGVAVVQNAARGGPLPASRTADVAEDTGELIAVDVAIEDDEADEIEEDDEADDAGERSPAAAASRLSRDDIRKLEAALHELSECRRLLDEALKTA